MSYEINLKNTGELICSHFEETNSYGIGFSQNGVSAAILNEIGRDVKYIKITSNGSNINGNNHITKLEIWDVEGTHNILIDSESDPSYWDKNFLETDPLSYTNDMSYPYFNTDKTITITLPNPTIITKLFLRRYYKDNRTYYQQKIESSLDKANWFTIYDSQNTDTYGNPNNTGVGLYPETINGKHFYLEPDTLMMYDNKAIISKEFIEE